MTTVMIYAKNTKPQVPAWENIATLIPPQHIQDRPPWLDEHKLRSVILVNYTSQKKVKPLGYYYI